MTATRRERRGGGGTSRRCEVRCSRIRGRSHLRVRCRTISRTVRGVEVGYRTIAGLVLGHAEDVVQRSPRPQRAIRTVWARQAGRTGRTVWPRPRFAGSMWCGWPVVVGLARMFGGRAMFPRPAGTAGLPWLPWTGHAQCLGDDGKGRQPCRADRAHRGSRHVLDLCSGRGNDAGDPRFGRFGLLFVLGTVGRA